MAQGPIALLTATARVEAWENAALLEPAFAAQGVEAVRAPIDSLHLAGGSICVQPPCGPVLNLATCERIWILGFGHRASFLDKMQLLALMTPQVPFVTAPQALLLWHGKYGLAAQQDLPHPPTWAFNDPESLIATAHREGGRFVLKPPGGSFGRGMVVADADSQRLAWAARSLTRQRAYCLLQRWVPEVAEGEWRILVAGGRVIDGYRRQPSRAASNLARGGQAQRVAIDPATRALAERSARWLAERQIGYAGIDIAGGWILEANIVNPGGLATLADLGAGDLAADVVTAVLAINPG